MTESAKEREAENDGLVNEHLEGSMSESQDLFHRDVRFVDFIRSPDIRVRICFTPPRRLLV